MSESLACQNHPRVRAADRCGGCAEPFCSNCMVEIYGQRYCGSCKVMALKGQPLPEFGQFPCKEATIALTLAIIAMAIGLCPFVAIISIILAIVALLQAYKASQLFESDPLYCGRERMRAARIIAVLALVLSVVIGLLTLTTMGAE